MFTHHFYPGKLEAAIDAMKAKRRELIANPLTNIYLHRPKS
jgi:hypothetical protein